MRWLGRELGFGIALVFVIFHFSGRKELSMTELEKPVRLEKHGDVRVDEFFWMKERDSAPVLKFLEAENARVAEATADVQGLKEKMVQEMRSRVKEDDQTVPIKEGEFHYLTRFEKGKEYPIYLRRRGSPEAKDEVIADINDLAKGFDYYSASINVSPNHQVMALMVDTKGRRFYDIRFKNLVTGEFLSDQIPSTTGNLVWAKDNRTLFFSRQHPETLRSYQIYRYELGGKAPELVYEEKDETFRVYVSAGKDNEFLFLTVDSTLSTEVHYLKADDPHGQWQVVLPREKDHEYSVTYGGDRFFILTNWQAKNFRVMEAPFSARDKSAWREVIPHRPDVYLEDLDVYRGHVVTEERFNGLTRISVMERSTKKIKAVEFPDETYVTGFTDLPEYDSPVLRYSYESLVRPASVFDYNFASQQSTLRKEREVPGYDRTKYVTRRLWATAQDGTKVPISLLQNKDRSQADGPLLLYGYGSYGYSVDPHFNSNVFSLVDRGFAYAIAHIRGGSEMGRHWYEDGKLLKKKNTFMDFIACAEHLIAQRYTSAAHLYMMGGSAGGLLMGAVMNLRPDLFKGVVAAVPFVDVITTMLDDSIPLTTSEYDEWGNPNDPKYYDYMKSYSPYDNVKPQAYPNVLVTTGYHDSQVQYWEPAKWVARLRAKKTDKNLLLFKTEMGAGHSGKTGRFERLKEIGLDYAFLLKLEGHKD